MGEWDRSRPAEVCHALHEAYKGEPDLPPHGQPPSGATTSWVQKIESMARYLGVEIDDALEIAEKIKSDV
jgi:hypothetical protein